MAAGEAIFSPGVAARVLAYSPTRTRGSRLRRRSRSSPTASEVLDLLAAGRRTAAIAAELYLSPKTVSNHLTTVFAKLQVAGRAEAIVLARDHGLGGSP